LHHAGIGKNFLRSENIEAVKKLEKMSAAKGVKFKGRNRSWNRGKFVWNPEPEPEPRQNGTVPQHWFLDLVEH
jgi:hypothetical protein